MRMPMVHGVFLLQALDVLANGGAGPGGGDELQPFRHRVGLRVGEDSHRLAMLQAGGQAALPPCRPALPAGVIADISVDGIGEIQRAGIAAQVDDFAFGREHKNFIRKQVGFGAVEKLHGVAGVALYVHQLHQPLACPHLRRAAR